MSLLPDQGGCNCGFLEHQQSRPALPPRTRIVRRGGDAVEEAYIIGRCLGVGGFGITYIGWDNRFKRVVAIKEYFPATVADRSGDGVTVAPRFTQQEAFEHSRKAFLLEARTLAQFSHENIVRVFDFLEANGTAYLIMQYYPGETLGRRLRGGRMKPASALAVLGPVLDGLREVHRAGFLHRDIKPDNIILSTNGLPVLVDFGATRMVLGQETRSVTSILTPGYAPFEQYTSNGKQGPQTDIYACGATLYRMLTGENPPEAPNRVSGAPLVPPAEIAADVPQLLSDVVLQAMAMDAERRPSDIPALQQALRDALAGDAPKPRPEMQPPAQTGEAGSDGPTVRFETPRGEDREPQRTPPDAQAASRWPVWAAIASALVAVAAGAAFYINGPQLIRGTEGESPAPAAAIDAPTATPSPTPTDDVPLPTPTPTIEPRETPTRKIEPTSTPRRPRPAHTVGPKVTIIPGKSQRL